MQVPLEALALFLAGLDHARTGALELLDAGSEVCLQPPVLERDPRRGSDRVEELPLFDELAVMDQRGDLAAVSVEHR